MCQQCFCQYDDIGFIKLDQVNFLEWIIQYIYLVSLSHVQLFLTSWTVARQAPLSMGFSKQEYWSWFPLPSPGDLPNPRIKPRSPALQAESLHRNNTSSLYIK